MSTHDFDSVVSEFFDEQGWSCKAYLIKYTDTYNAATSENVQTEKKYETKTIPFDYINKFQGATKEPNTLIRSGDKQVWLKPSKYFSDIDPSKDKLQMGNRVYEIVTVKECNPTLNNCLYYELFVRI
jgi:hypothetical protein